MPKPVPLQDRIMIYPYKFQPIFVERIWGGRELARFGKTLPPGQRIGESWEMVDRPEAQSVVANGPHRGLTLHDLIAAEGASRIVGTAGGVRPAPSRFPLLVKLLDARERLSLQVHPPSAVAPRLGGEPKTEMWHVLEAAPGAHLLAGLKRGVTRPQFEAALAAGQLEPLVHRFPVRAGDAMFIPSGRIHAIDAGLVLIEIQQNSDTTYRVYDWGRPRELHVAASLASMDFTDYEPAPQPYPIVCESFRVERVAAGAFRCDGTSFQILTPLTGPAAITSAAGTESLTVGEFALLPAALGDYVVRGADAYLRCSIGT
jgi:mannose-6-phosphate isomerase